MFSKIKSKVKKSYREKDLGSSSESSPEVVRPLMGRFTFKWRLFSSLEVTTATQIGGKQELLDRMSIILDEYAGSLRIKDTVMIWYCISGWLVTERKIEGGLYQYKADISGRFSMNYASALPDTAYPLKHSYIHTPENIKVEDSIAFRLNLDTTVTSCIPIEEFIRKRIPDVGDNFSALAQGYGALFKVAQGQMIWN